MFYPSPENTAKVQFAGDVNSVLSAHRYKVFAPNTDLLNIIVNGIVKEHDRSEIGALRLTECRLSEILGLSTQQAGPKTPVNISMADFKAARTAMFGKTRLGKSNVVKLIAKGMIEATASDNSVGQLIFDVNGEYANDNPQNKALRSVFPNRCIVYALTKRAATPSEPLRLNFYEQPDACHSALGSLLAQDKRRSIYIDAFVSAPVPSIESISELNFGERDRPVRKIQIYWAILHAAGFPADEKRLRKLGLKANNAKDFDPGFAQAIRTQVYGQKVPAAPSNLDELAEELRKFAAKNREQKLKSTSGKDLFDADDTAMLDFLAPSTGAGPTVLRAYIQYHAPDAGDFISGILSALDAGKTVILDLGNATDAIRRYFSDMLSRSVFAHQERKFVNDQLGTHYVQLYFEEAHNLFPANSSDLTGVYARFAKEGAKFHIGMLYSTQSPSTINKELLTQTENFFVGHLSSADETKALSRLQVQFAGLEEDIMRAKTPGYMRMITQSHRFVVPVAAHLFAG